MYALALAYSLTSVGLVIFHFSYIEQLCSDQAMVLFIFD